MEVALSRLESARPFSKHRFQHAVLDVAARMIREPGGLARLYALAPRLDAAGLFHGTDWDDPDRLVPSLTRHTFAEGALATVTLEALSELRLLAIANGDHPAPSVRGEHAHHFLTQVLALNLDRVFGATGEAARAQGPASAVVDALIHYLLERIGFERILPRLVDEIWRILTQRPLVMHDVKAMITQIAITLARGVEAGGDASRGADRLISALFGPTHGTKDDPGIEAYTARLADLDDTARRQEATGFARAMHDTGLVSDYHAAFLRWCVDNDASQIMDDALGLTPMGQASFRAHRPLVTALIREAVHPATAQSVLGLACLLNNGTLETPSLEPALWRQIALSLAPGVEGTLGAVFGTAVPARTLLLAGTVHLLGQPLGVGQGNNPTCQAARAISMWALVVPDYLAHLIAQVAQHDALLLHFEGQPIDTAALPAGLSLGAPFDTDPVSVVMVPHLDRAYAEMGRLCAGRGEDPHRWINPEFHGWWVGRDFAIAVDVASGALRDHDGFAHRFFASYHPDYNGGRPVVHPQPAGIAATDASGRFVGWHAITILRVARDPRGQMRVYFFNPNDDSAQDWGGGVVVSTEGAGERHGESSLPFEQFLSRLYLYHDDPRDAWEPVAPADALDRVRALALQSWARDRTAPRPAAASS